MTIDENKIKDKIVSYVRRNPGMTYVEIERIFTECCFDYKGDMGIIYPKFQNIILWAGWNQTACDMVNSLLNDGVLAVHPTSQLTYIIDGAVPAFPIAEEACLYESPHWLPITFNLNSPQGR